MPTRPWETCSHYGSMTASPLKAEHERSLTRWNRGQNLADVFSDPAPEPLKVPLRIPGEPRASLSNVPGCMRDSRAVLVGEGDRPVASVPPCSNHTAVAPLGPAHIGDSGSCGDVASITPAPLSPRRDDSEGHDYVPTPGLHSEGVLPAGWRWWPVLPQLPVS